MLDSIKIILFILINVAAIVWGVYFFVKSKNTKQYKPDLSDAGLKAWADNLEILAKEYELATDKVSDDATCEDVLEWMLKNKDLLKTKFHPNTAFILGLSLNEHGNLDKQKE